MYLVSKCFEEISSGEAVLCSALLPSLAGCFFFSQASAKEKITADCFAGLRRVEIQSEQTKQHLGFHAGLPEEMGDVPFLGVDLLIDSINGLRSKFNAKDRSHSSHEV